MFFAHFVNSSWTFGPVDLLNDCFRTNAKHSFRPLLPLKPTFRFPKEENLRKCFTNGKEALFFPLKKKVLPCVFALQKFFRFCEKQVVVVRMPCPVPSKAEVCFWKKGTLTTKSFKQAPFFNKQAHFSRKCGFPLKKSNKMETAGVRENSQVCSKGETFHEKSRKWSRHSYLPTDSFHQRSAKKMKSQVSL